MGRYFTHKFPNFEGCVLIINSVGMDSISFNVYDFYRSSPT